MYKILYGLAFCVALPFMLWQWAAHLCVELPLALPTSLALIVAMAGAILCLWSMASLMTYGKGLPMNAFPPQNFVNRGPYVLFAHPIYVGFCLMLYGLAAYYHSASGFYLVAPVVSLCAMALAMGYENFDMLKRFPYLRYEPLVGLIESTKEHPDYKDKIRLIGSLSLAMLFILMQGIGQSHGQLPEAAPLVLLVYEVLLIGLVCSITNFSSLRIIGLRLLVMSIIFALKCSFFMLIIGSILGFLAPYFLRSAHRLLGALANSWHAWHFGKVRVINHGFYAGSAALLGFMIWDILTPRQATGPIFILCLAGLLGAGIWGQALEGSGRLKRPFGYFGALFAGGLGFLVMLAYKSDDLWRIYGALAIAFCFAQGLGRLRCLVNGCCHGAIAPRWLGICVWNPESRVSKISSLAQKPVYPSQVYSGLILLASGSFLWLMWAAHARFALIVGMYFILGGIGRFLEEATRGEIQTKIIAGLRIYQWLAILMVAVGILISCLDAPLSPGGMELQAVLDHLPLYLTIALVFTFAFGIDFPKSRRRFSSL